MPYNPIYGKQKTKKYNFLVTMQNQMVFIAFFVVMKGFLFALQSLWKFKQFMQRNYLRIYSNEF